MKDEKFGEMTRDEDDGTLEGTVTFERFAQWGAALDEKDPPDTRPAETPDRSPTKAQVEAREKLAELATHLGGEEAALLSGFMKNMEALIDGPTIPQDSDRAGDDVEDADMRRLRQGTLTLIIEPAPGRGRGNPPEAQRRAWDAVFERGDALWDELLEQSFEAYKHQLPVRRKWWKVIYGDYLLDKRLPQVDSIKKFRRLIRPGLIRIKAPVGKKDSCVEIAMHVLATWDVDGIGVIIRGGRVDELGQVMDTVHTSAKRYETLDHPVLGPLRRVVKPPKKASRPGKGPPPWKGVVRFDPMLDFAMVVDERAKYAHDRARADRPESRMAWEFANGEFEIHLYAPAGDEPSAAQADAWRAFKAGEKKFADDMIRTVFDQYLEVRDILHRNYKDRYADDNVPAISDPGGLRELIQLRHIHVHPPDEQGRVTIAFQFVASYNYDGFTAFWRDGKFVEWGEWKDAPFKGFE